MLIFPPLSSFIKPAVTYTFNQVITRSASEATSTFTGVDFGAVAADRLILVTYTGNGGNTSVTGTVGGVSLTTVASEFDGGGGQDAWIGIAAVPTGTSGTVVVNHSTGTYVGAVYSIYGSDTEPFDTDADIVDNVTVGTCTLDIPDDSFAVSTFSFGSSGALTSFGWTGLTENHETFSGTNYTYGGGAADAFETESLAQAITCTRTGGAGDSWQPMCAASFAPKGTQTFRTVIADDWEASAVKASYTLSSGSLQPDGTDSGLRLISDYNFDGDFSFRATFTTIGTEAGFGVYDVAEDATFNTTLSWGNLNSFTASWFWAGSTNHARYGGANQAAISFTAGDTIEIKRVGSTLQIKKNGATAHTWSQTSSNTLRLVIGCGNSSVPVWNDIRVTV